MADDPVLFEAVQDVVIGGVKVIRSGVSGQGTVTAAQHRQGFDRRGKLEFTLAVRLRRSQAQGRAPGA